MPPSRLLDSVATLDPPGDRTLARLIGHVRALVPASAALVVAGERSARWSVDPDLDEALAGLGEAEEPRLIARLEDAPELLSALVAAAGPQRARRIWKACRGAAVIACPLRADDGRLLGRLVIGGDHLGDDELRTMEIVAELASVAIERAELLDVETRLIDAGEAMSSSLELTDVYRTAVEHAVSATGARQAALHRLDARMGDLRTVASFDRRAPVPEPGGAGLRQIARTRAPLGADGGRVVHAPIELGPRLFGVLSVAREERFDEGARGLLARLARSSAAAIANAIDFERERHVARSLTLGFVPASLPRVAGYETGLLYAPALGEPTGGDLYGLWTLPSGAVAALVGDVAGKGVETAALSSMVRFFIEARSWDAESPARVLEQTNAMLTGRLPRDTFVTAFLAVLSPGSLRWASAGHLPPLHLSGGIVRELEATGVPLGVSEGSGWDERELELADGDLVFAYTDGLVEARRGDEAYGAERLARLVAELAAGCSPEELARAVHDEIASWAGGLSDDAVALALRRRP